MTRPKVSPFFVALALASAASVSHAQTVVTEDVQPAQPSAKAPALLRREARSQATTNNSFTDTRGNIPAGNTQSASSVVPGSTNLNVSPGTRTLRDSSGNVTIIIGDNQRPIYAPPYNYPAYNYPAYPSYGYPGSTYGASVSVSTPGFESQNFRLFPWSSTVTTWGTAPAYNNCPPQYPRYNSYPAYPTYVPGPAINGYRGAAGYGNYNYNGGSFPGGAYVTTPGMVTQPPYIVSNRVRSR